MTHDPVNHPSHYNSGAVECIDAIEAAMTVEEFVGYLRGQMIKYVWRAGKKDDARQDIEKALWYGRRLSSLLEGAPLFVQEAAPVDSAAWRALDTMAHNAIEREAKDMAPAPREAAEGSTAVDYDRLSTLEDHQGNVILERTDAVDWSKAPSWADYMAVDADEPGEEVECLAYWFQYRPEWRQDAEFWSSGGQGGRISSAPEYNFGAPRLFCRVRAPA